MCQSDSGSTPITFHGPWFHADFRFAQRKPSPCGDSADEVGPHWGCGHRQGRQRGHGQAQMDVSYGAAAPTVAMADARCWGVRRRNSKAEIPQRGVATGVTCSCKKRIDNIEPTHRSASPTAVYNHTLRYNLWCLRPSFTTAVPMIETNTRCKLTCGGH